MNEREKLALSIATLEQQRATLGDSAVDTVIAGLRQKLAEIQAETAPPAPAKKSTAGERKLVTIMFADLSGFTALSEKLDPEQVRSIINAYFNLLVPIVEKYGGVVDKFIGDEIMAMFGAPVAHENDAECALRAALEMMQAIATFQGPYQARLGMHIGINSGGRSGFGWAAAVFRYGRYGLPGGAPGRCFRNRTNPGGASHPSPDGGTVRIRDINTNPGEGEG